MAAIDKTYVSSWAQWKELRDWIWDKEFDLHNGAHVVLRDWMYYPDNTQEDVEAWLENVRQDEIKYHSEYYKEKYGDDWEKHIVVDVPFWNTSVYVDIYMIRNCPIEWVQDRLKVQYGGGWSKESLKKEKSTYEQIKEGTSVYDTYQRNGLGEDTRITFIKYPKEHERYKFLYRERDNKLRMYNMEKSWWFVDVEPLDRSKHEFWDYDEDLDYWATNKEAVPWTSSSAHIQGVLTKKKVYRLIKKWNLPAGMRVKFNNMKFNEFDIEVVTKPKRKRK